MNYALIIITIIAIGIAIWAWARMRRLAKQQGDQQNNGKNSDDGQSLKQRVTSWEDHIIVLSGPSLAASGIIAGLDVLTGSLIKTYFPVVSDAMGMIWAICLMLTLDFQVLTLGVRVRKIYQSDKSGGAKFVQILLSLLIAAFLAYVSLQMASIFAKMLSDTKLTLDTAQAALGIDANWLIYERSALVMVLIFMSGLLRDDNFQESTAAKQQTTALDNLLMVMQQIQQALEQIVEGNKENKAFAQQNITLLQQTSEQTQQAMQQIAKQSQQNAEQIALEATNHAEQLIASAKQIATSSQQTSEELRGQFVESLAAGIEQIKDAVISPRQKLHVVRPTNTEQRTNTASKVTTSDQVTELDDDVLDMVCAELADIVDRNDVITVLQAFNAGVGKSEIYKFLNWGSKKHSMIVKPVVDTYLSIQSQQQQTIAAN